MRRTARLLALAVAVGCASSPDDRPSPPRGGPARPSPSPSPAASETVTLEEQDADVRDVVAKIAKASSKNLLVDPSLSERVTVSLVELPWREAVDLVARLARCDVRQLGGGALLLTRPVVVTFHEADLAKVLHLIARYAGKSLVMTGDVRGTAGASMTGVRWQTAFERVVEGAHLHAGRVGEILVVSAKPLPFSAAAIDDEEARIASSGAPIPDAKVDLDVRDETVERVLVEIGRQLKLRVVAPPTATEKVSIAVRGAQWRDVVTFLARVSRLTVRSERGSVLVLAARPRNAIEAARAPAATWFRLLARHAGKSVAIAGDVKGEIDAAFRDVPFEVALAVTARLAGFEVVDDEGDQVILRGAR